MTTTLRPAICPPASAGARSAPTPGRHARHRCVAWGHGRQGPTSTAASTGTVRCKAGGGLPRTSARLSAARPGTGEGGCRGWVEPARASARSTQAKGKQSERMGAAYPRRPGGGQAARVSPSQPVAGCRMAGRGCPLPWPGFSRRT